MKCYYFAPWLIITSQSQKLCFVLLNGDRKITDWPFSTLYQLLSVNSLRSVWVLGGLSISFLSTNTAELPLSWKPPLERQKEAARVTFQLSHTSTSHIHPHIACWSPDPSNRQTRASFRAQEKCRLVCGGRWKSRTPLQHRQPVKICWVRNQIPQLGSQI